MAFLPRAAALVAALAFTLHPVLAHLCEANCSQPAAAQTAHSCHDADGSLEASQSIGAPAHDCGHGLAADMARPLLRKGVLPRALAANLSTVDALTSASYRLAPRPTDSPTQFRSLRATVLRI